MEKKELFRLEREQYCAYPFNTVDFIQKLRGDLKDLIETTFEQCQNKFHVIAKENGSDDEEDLEHLQNELDNHIDIVKNQCLNNCDRAINKVKDKLDEVTYIPIDLKLPDDMPSNEELQKEYENLKEELIQQKVFMRYLQQELADFEEIDPILKQYEELQALKEQPVADVSDIQEKLKDLTCKSSEIVYNNVKIL